MNKLVLTGAFAALVLAGCAGIGAAQPEGAAAAAAAPVAPPAAAAPAAAATSAPRPGMPQPITLSSRPGTSGGEALYVEKCIMCHGPVGMGTGLLARRQRPEPQLERRGDLVAAFVILAARNGIGNMPAIPRGEVSDADLQAIADYLAAGPHGGQSGEQPS